MDLLLINGLVVEQVIYSNEIWFSVWLPFATQETSLHLFFSVIT